MLWSVGMADEAKPLVDRYLERSSKVAGMLVPFLVFFFGLTYNRSKDAAERLAKEQESAHKAETERAAREQMKFANFSSLLPLLTSDKPEAQSAGLEIYTAQAQKDLAPVELKPLIERLAGKGSTAAQAALTAVQNQQSRDACNSLPDGLYVHVDKNSTQFDDAHLLGRKLGMAEVPFRGVQHVDHAPSTTLLKYYKGGARDAEAEMFVQHMRDLGLAKVQEADLTSYLRKGCPAPRIYELWIAPGETLH